MGLGTLNTMRNLTETKKTQINKTVTSVTSKMDLAISTSHQQIELKPKLKTKKNLGCLEKSQQTKTRQMLIMKSSQQTRNLTTSERTKVSSTLPTSMTTLTKQNRLKRLKKK